MPLRPVFAFALAATTLLAVGVGSARADAGAPESGATAVIEPPADVTQTSPTATGSAAAPTGAGGTTVVSGGSVTGGTTTGAITPGGTRPPSTQTTTVPPAPQPAGTSGAGSPTTGEVVPAGTQPTQTPATLAQQPPVEPAGPAPTLDASLPAPRESSFVQAPHSPPPPSGAPPAAPPRPVPTATGPGTILEEMLPGVDRRLRSVQASIGHMRRQLAEGATPPSRDFAQLRLELHLIAPALLALETRISAASPLSPDLRHLLHGVHGRLADTRASAAALAAALRRSGVHTPEAQLLLRELEAFSVSGADGLTLAVQPAPAMPPSAPDTARVYASPSPAPPPARSDGTHAARSSGGESGASVQGHPPPDPAPAASSAGSASAGSGGGFSAAGVAALAALLFGLALPQLLSRLQLPTVRAYAAGFLTPLEQPG